ncbi:hypothetical protein BC937DRAFT_93253 [Endogone sp. FLAS-F59071]|nr:hypothetical protein BC937DRAFT_93253 [Endogone sp. FLAS-F59071]|eukprot:RUS14831.1 hypothetical protein BC937DRAFT_93253 [Endogone sp. FLAS-F59071]
MLTPNSPTVEPPPSNNDVAPELTLTDIHPWTQDLPKELKPLFLLAATHPQLDYTWSEEEIEKVAGPLYRLSPDKWNEAIASPRLRLLGMLPVPDSTSPLTTSFMLNTVTYRILMRGAGCQFQSESSAADDLEPFMSILLSKKKWISKSKAVRDFAKVIRGKICIDHAKSSPEAFAKWLVFDPRWSAYVSAHPLIRQQVDPVYVVADVGGIAIPAWPPLPADGPLGPLAPLNGAAYGWVFANTEDASFWSGVVRNAIPGQHLWIGLLSLHRNYYPHALLDQLISSLTVFDRTCGLTTAGSLYFKSSFIVRKIKGIGRLLSNWIRSLKFNISGQFHLKPSQKTNQYLDIVLMPPRTWTWQKPVILELLATATEAELKEHFTRAISYKNNFSVTVGDLWVVHFTCEDEYLRNPCWQTDSQLNDGLNVVHFWHDRDCKTLALKALA